MIDKYADKLVRAGLAEKEGVLIGLGGAHSLWNRTDKACAVLETVLAAADRRAVIYAEPAEPYRTIIKYLAESSGDVIEPRDFETRIFLQDLPVLKDFDAEAMATILKRRRSVVVRGRGVVAVGKAGPEAAFIIYSSVCFACYVKFFSDTLYHVRRGTLDKRRQAVLQEVLEKMSPEPETARDLMSGPFTDEQEIFRAMDQAGRLLVESRLVDSNFGNISYYSDPVLYISPKGGALDELHGRIVSVEMNDSHERPERASTEYPAHRGIVLATGRRAVLHGHPKFAVVLSMDCERDDCEGRSGCHLHCPHERYACGIPVVSGEAGAGLFGLNQTVPPALRNHSAVIVYGHGLFTAGRHDYTDAFESLSTVEKVCRREYLRRVGYAT